MKIAIPHENGHLHGHFGGCQEFALLEVDPATKSILRTEVLPAPEHQPGIFPQWLRNHGVEAVIAGGIGQRALDVFSHHGIQVRGGTPGTPIQQLASAYLDGALTTPPSGCGQHGHPHGHGHGHGHGCHQH